MNKKYTLDHEYFNISNVYNNYWAGLISADGNVYKQEKHSSSLIIQLSGDDGKHIESFKNIIKYTGVLHYKKSGTYKYKKSIGISKPSTRITIKSEEICKSLLKNWNITPKKSLTLKPPNITNQEEILSYIIGYIDGDGWIGIEQNKLVFGVLGTKLLLEWINNQFNNIGKITKTKSNIYQLRFRNLKTKEILIKLKKHIIKYNLKVLDRKWNKIKEEEQND